MAQSVASAVKSSGLVPSPSSLAQLTMLDHVPWKSSAQLHTKQFVAVGEPPPWLRPQ